jgi:hypothetical protein
VTNSAVAGECLDRISTALHGKRVVPTLFGHLNTLITSQDWRYREAAMFAISFASEGSKAVLLPHLSEVVTSVTSLANDPHPRVRWAVVNCLAQLLIDFEPEMQEKFTSVSVGLITKAMADPVVRVQAHGATAIVNFVNTTEVEHVLPHLPTLLGGLAKLMQAQHLKL